MEMFDRFLESLVLTLSDTVLIILPLGSLLGLPYNRQLYSTVHRSYYYFQVLKMSKTFSPTLVTECYIGTHYTITTIESTQTSVSSLAI